MCLPLFYARQLLPAKYNFWEVEMWKYDYEFIITTDTMNFWQSSQPYSQLNMIVVINQRIDHLSQYP